MTTWSPQQDAALKANFRAAHGHTAKRSRSPEYKAWASMVARCIYPDRPGYQNYGGRGITVCDRWRYGENGLNAFQCFLADVGPRPSAGHSVDRVDNDGNYQPSNVRWAIRADQRRNSRSARIFDVYGVPLCLRDLHAAVGRTPYQTAVSRLALGWKIEDALFTPPRAQRGDWHPDCRGFDADQLTWVAA